MTALRCLLIVLALAAVPLGAGCGLVDLARCGPSGWHRASELQETSTELTEGIPAQQYYAPIERSDRERAELP